MTITRLAVEPQLTGRTDITCTCCPWSLPPGLHRDGNTTDHTRRALDAVLDVAEHLCWSGHVVVVVVRVFWADYTEVHTYRCRPRVPASTRPQPDPDETSR